ncbi:hypothetical protein GCM10010492_59770 [Saccharothrix mutabilis subsp. mutabilis]|uniref:Uncharacterized protein n=1 Tax=Saccharothrix mutabilis subsp. mutabilis TaxID=66855 RepID=A0ABP3E3F6_9PSEU
MSRTVRVTLTRSVPTDADAVFEVMTDLDDVSVWLPAGLDVDRYGPDLVRLWIGRGGVHHIVERRVDVDWESRRITWGTAGASYSGTARVLHIAPGRSAVTAQVELHHATHRATVETWLHHALDGLAEAVAAEHDCAPWWAGTVLT